MRPGTAQWAAKDARAAGPTAVRGLSAEQDGYLLSEVSAPHAVGSAGELSFRVTDADGDPLTAYTTSALDASYDDLVCDVTN